MAQPGYKADPLHTHPPQALYANQSYPTYPGSYCTDNSSRTTAYHYAEAAKESNAHNRHVIPGLGLGFSNALQHQSPWAASQPGNMQIHSQLNELIKPFPTKDRLLDENRRTSAGEIINDASKADMVEEGEVGERELEDIYEPKEAEEGEQNGAIAGDVVIGDLTHGPPASHIAGRDRSGSYSPYLSPREIDQQLSANTREKVYVREPSHVASSTETHAPSHMDDANKHRRESLNIKNIVDARKQARDAILRLWPLNVRYQNYLNEGIDEALLESLFKELGFEVGVSTGSAVPKPNKEPEENPSTGIEKESAAPGESQQPVISGTIPAETKQDKSEERKDRIARLLAAKNSKPSNPTPAPAPVSASIPAPAPITTCVSSVAGQSGLIKKIQSQKSKLLYQKIEALQKAREIRGQKQSHPKDTVARSQGSTNPAFPEPITESSPCTTENQEPAIAQEQRPSLSKSPNAQSTQPIPGLSLSSPLQTSQPSPSLSQDRPGTSSFGGSSARPFKRPFGQTRGSRPFLIDVSDDEDDAEMDIDSPEQHSLSIPRPTTPSLKTTSIRGASYLVDKTPSLQYFSSIPTPPGMKSDASAKDDLEIMNKQIEDMKRKIAEAEARTKAKQSRLDSPAFPPPNHPSRDECFEAPDSSKKAIVPPVSTFPVELQDNRSSPQLPTNASPRKLPKSLDMWSLSERPCSTDRLPSLQKRRRDQQFKLQLFQAQVASIEKELEEIVQEENRLKEDFTRGKSVSNGAEPPQAENSTLGAAVVASPTTESMDTTTTSSAHSEDFERSRNTTPVQTQELSEEHVADMRVSKQDEPQVDKYVDHETEMLEQATTTVGKAMFSAALAQDRSSATTSDVDQDATAQKASNSNGRIFGDASDSYEPPDVEPSSSSLRSSRASSPFSPALAEQNALLEADGRDTLGVTADLPAAQQTSAQQDSASEAGREADELDEAPASSFPQPNFVPYESPLRYFRSYRFHPEFNHSVAGGLRSLTYSNKIDVTQEICPQELAGQSCPRGKQCEYQHFENMQAPDDQILLQLGAHGNFDEKQKQEYITGLRQLLTDFRRRKVKDFQTISQGIIDYRAQFLGDKSKILSLGNITI